MEPVTIAAAGAGGVGLWAWIRSKFSAPLPPTTPGCSQAEQAALAQQTAVGAASGAAGAAPAGPVSAGAGAGIGALGGVLGTAFGPCGQAATKAVGRAIKDLGKSACDRAAEGYQAYKKAGGKTIPGWAGLSCEQRLAALAAAGPSVGLVIVGGMIVGGANAAVDAATSTHVSGSVSTKGGSVKVGGTSVKW